MRRLIIICLFLITSNIILASKLDSLYLGLSGGLNNENFFKGDIYLGHRFKIKSLNTEIKLGCINQNYTTKFINVENLKFNSFGFYGDFNVFLIKGLFLGVRWELINFNTLTSDAKTEFDKKSTKETPGLFSGTSMFGQIGYKFKISDKFRIFILGQAGVHSYKISTGSTIGSTTTTTNPDDLIIENHSPFVYNFNFGLEFNVGK